MHPFSESRVCGQLTSLHTEKKEATVCRILKHNSLKKKNQKQQNVSSPNNHIGSHKRELLRFGVQLRTTRPDNHYQWDILG